MIVWGPFKDHPAESFWHLFAAQTERAPTNVAVLDQQGSLSYSELLAAAVNMGAHLRATGARSGDPIAVQMSVSRQWLAAVLGILAIDGIYVPIYRNEAPARMRHILDASGARFLLRHGERSAGADVEIRQLHPFVPNVPAEAHARRLNPESPAYVIFTSGSSGTPKGAPIAHASLAHYACSIGELYGMSERDRVLAFALPSFDVSIQELCLALPFGAALVLPNERERTIPDLLAALIERSGTTVCELPQSILLRLHERLSTRLRLLSMGGEPIGRAAINSGLGIAAVVYNGYGPTETTVAVTQKRFTNAIDHTPTLGYPMDNHGIGLFDEAGELLNAGQAGEIGICGPGVMRGYVGAEPVRFAHVRQNARTLTFYLTGDQGRLAENGELVFLGRRDAQIKLDGYRIEIGEVENALLAHPHIQRAVVALQTETCGKTTLGAMIQTEGGHTLEDYWQHMRERLPWHMIPKNVTYVAWISTNRNGKTDRMGRSLWKSGGDDMDAMTERAKGIIPLGVSSPLRACLNVDSEPLFVEKAEGERLECHDGRTYRDFLYGFGPMILGHSHPRVVEAIRSAATDCQVTATGSRREIELAEAIADTAGHLERIRFVNSGTEAVMSAIRVARAYTKRPRIVRMRGGYHGHADGVQDAGVENAAARGLDPNTSMSNILVDVNDETAIDEIMDLFGPEIAAVLIEPILCNATIIKPSADYLRKLRGLCDRNGALLVFDEVITGFRFNYGPVATPDGTVPDLTVFGKIIGGGLPVGAYGGRAEIMRLLETQQVYQGGTFSGNPVVMAAGRAVLEELRDSNAYHEIADKATFFQKVLDDRLGPDSASGMVCRHGGVFSFKLNGSRAVSHSARDLAGQDRELYTRIYRSARRRSIHLAPDIVECNYISAATSREALTDLVDVLFEYADAASEMSQHSS